MPTCDTPFAYRTPDSPGEREVGPFCILDEGHEGKHEGNREFVTYRWTFPGTMPHGWEIV